MSLHTSASGVLREIVQPYAGYGNVVRRLSTVTAGVNGVKRSLFPVYRWQKWSVVSRVIGYEDFRDPTYQKITKLSTDTPFVKMIYDYTFYPDTGMYGTVGGIYNIRMGQVYERPVYYTLGFTPYIYEIHETKFVRANGSYDEYDAYGYRHDAIENKIQEQGSSRYEDVTSTNPNAYPQNGVHTDGYWYVRI